MKMCLLWCPVLAVVLSGCLVDKTMRSLSCNQQAIEMSTDAIRCNAQAIEESNAAIEENRRQLDAINQSLKKMSES